MDFNIDEAKQLFIRDELDQHGEFVLDLLAESIIEKELILDENLLSSLRYNVEKNGKDYVLTIAFPGYGRAVEISYYKRKKRNFETDTNQAVKQLFKIESREDVLRKKQKRQIRHLNWYSKNVYGSLNKLYSRLSYGFTEDEIERLKKIITSETYTAKESGWKSSFTNYQL